MGKLHQLTSRESGEYVARTMVELARCGKSDRIMLAGPNSRNLIFHLYGHGYRRVATAPTRGLPCGQYDVVFVVWGQPSVGDLAGAIKDTMPFLAEQSVLVTWIDWQECAEHRRLRAILARLGFRIEAGACCGSGIAVSARRLSEQAMAA